MNHVDCVIKRDVYPQKMHSCSKNIRSLSFFLLKISVAYKKYICQDDQGTDIRVVERYIKAQYFLQCYTALSGLFFYTEPQKKRRTKNTIFSSLYMYTMKLSTCVMKFWCTVIYCRLTFYDEYQHLVLQ